MAYTSFKMGDGLQLKADATSIPDGGLTRAYGCSFDTIGAVSSARGRSNLNSGNALTGSASILGHFDGLISRSSTLGKHTWTKCGSTVSEDFSGTAISGGWSAGGYLTGFCHNGYAYMADGTGLGRLKADLTTLQTWGLKAPGYFEFSGDNADPLSITSGGTMMTVTLAEAHGLGSIGSQNIEIVGLDSVGGIPTAEINLVHAPFSEVGGDLSIATNGTTLAAGSTYTLTFIGDYANRDIKAVGFDLTPLGYTGVNGSIVHSSGETTGSSTANEVQTFVKSGTFSSGYFRIRFENNQGRIGHSIALPYNATSTDFLSAMQGITYGRDPKRQTYFFRQSRAVAAVCTMTSTTAFTFATITTAGSTVNQPPGGGGSIGFMRQGPTLTLSDTGGGLASGLYYYAYTFYNGVAESNFSAQIPIYGKQGAKVVLTNILVGPEGTTERRIYRTDVNGRQLYRIGVLTDLAATTFTDVAKLGAGADPNTLPGDPISDLEQPTGLNDDLSQPGKSRRRGILEAFSTRKVASKRKKEITSTNLGLLCDWVEHDPAPTGLKHVGVIGGTAVGIVGNDLAFSAADNVEHWPLSNRITTGRSTSETLYSWLPFDNDIIVYTSAGLYRVRKVGLTFEDSAFEEIESPVGLAAEWGAVALDGQQGHVFLTKAGLYLFDGARVSEISFPIETMFTDSAHADYIHPTYMTSAVMATSRDRLYMSYATTSGGNNRFMIVDFQDQQNPKVSVISSTDSVYYTTLVRERADNRLVGGTSASRVYTLDDTYALGTSNVTWDITTKDFRLNGGGAFALDEVVLDASFGGATTTVTVVCRQRGDTKTSTHSVATTGRQRAKLKVPTYMKGETVKVTISSADTDKRDLYAVGFTYRPMDEP